MSSGMGWIILVVIWQMRTNRTPLNHIVIICKSSPNYTTKKILMVLTEKLMIHSCILIETISISVMISLGFMCQTCVTFYYSWNTN